MSLIASINHNADRSGLQGLPHRGGNTHAWEIVATCRAVRRGVTGTAFDTFEQISGNLPEDILVKLQKRNPKNKLGSSRDLPAGVGPITNRASGIFSGKWHLISARNQS